MHPQKDPKQWPGKEGLNIQKPRVHCSRRQFSDVVSNPTKQTTFPFQAPCDRKPTKETKFPFQEPCDHKPTNETTFPFQVPRGRKRKQPDQFGENVLVDEAT